MRISAAKLLPLFTLLYFTVRIPWLITLPQSQCPDEPNHLWVITFIADHMRLPYGSEVLAAGPTAEYGSLPPFGYVPQIIFCKLAALHNIEIAARLGSLFAGLVTLLMAVLTGLEIFSESALYAVALPVMVLFHPQLVFVNSYSNNDSLATSLVSVAIYLTIRAIKIGLTYRVASIMGILFGWIALSKYTALSLLPAIFLFLIYACWLNRDNIRTIANKMLSLICLFFISCGWWFARNFAEFQGDFLGSHTMYTSWSKILPTRNGQIINPWPPLTKISWWRYLLFDYWGLFGYMDRYLWRPIYIGYLALIVSSIAGWLKAASVSRNKANSFNQFQDRTYAIWLFFLICLLSNLVATIVVTLIGVSGPHGRYLFASEITIMALLLKGLSLLGSKLGTIYTSILLALTIVTCIGSWIVFYSPLH